MGLWTGLRFWCHWAYRACVVRGCLDFSEIESVLVEDVYLELVFSVSLIHGGFGSFQDSLLRQVSLGNAI